VTAVPPLAERFPGLDPVLAGLLDQAAAIGLPSISELTPAQARDRVRAGDAAVPAGPAMHAVTEHVIAPAGIPVRRYQPRDVRAAAAVVWFHGGGWVTGDLDYSDEICRLIADAAGAEVFSVAYRLAPEHPFPAAVQDALAAARWVAAGSAGLPPRSDRPPGEGLPSGSDRPPDASLPSGSDLPPSASLPPGAGLPPRPVVLAGDSAGGNLAAVCAQQLAPDPEVTLAGQLLVYPVLDDDVSRDSYHRNAGLVLGAREMTWFFDQYCPAADRASLLFAPLRAPDLAGLPPTVIAIAGHDPLYDEGAAYAQALAAVGVPVTLLDYPGLVHGFLRFTGSSPGAAAAAREIAGAAARLAGPS
jgi:acetyl esterase